MDHKGRSDRIQVASAQTKRFLGKALPAGHGSSSYQGQQRNPGAFWLRQGCDFLQRFESCQPFALFVGLLWRTGSTPAASGSGSKRPARPAAIWIRSNLPQVTCRAARHPVLARSLAVFFAFGISLLASHAFAQGKVLGVRDMIKPAWWQLSFLDIAEDAAAAAEEGKHLIMYFHLKGCPYCAKMAEENFSTSSYVDFLKESFYVVEIDTRGDREVTLPDGTTITEGEYADQLQVRFTPGLLFFKADAELVLRVDGYRSNEQFEPILRYVASKSYETMDLYAYLAQEKQKKAQSSPMYTLANKPYFADIANLHDVPDKPLMVLFEDATCSECPAFHRNYLEDSYSRELMDKMTVVRLDALSEEPLVDHQGRTTTPKAYAAALGVSYRPGLVLIDRREVKGKRDSISVLYHFQTQLAYIATRAYLQQSRREFSRQRQQQLLEEGQNIDLSL